MKLSSTLIKCGIYAIGAIVFMSILNGCSKKDTAPPPSSNKEITSFQVTAADGTLLDTTDIRVSITSDSIKVGVPYGTDIKHLKPSITFKGITLSPSGTDVQDFSVPVSYTVTAEDSSIHKYVVVVSIRPLNNIVYMGTNDNTFFALNALTGKLRWKYTGTKSFAYSTPAIKDTIVYVGSIDNNVYAFHALTGKVLWTFPTTANGIEASVTVDGNTVYVGANDYNLYALDAKTGVKKWQYATGANVSSAAVVVNGVVYFGSSDANVYALNASTGQFIWKYTTGAMINASGPAVVNGTVYVGSRDGNLYAIDAASGTQKWKYYTGVSLEMSSPAVGIGAVYIGGWYDVPGFTKKGSVYAINTNTGALIWEAVPSTGFSSSPTVVNGYLYISGDDMFIHAINVATGKEVWSNKIIPNSGNATVSDGVVFSGGGGSGYMYALDAVTGSQKWKFATANGIDISGAVVLDSLGNAHYPGISGMQQ